MGSGSMRFGGCCGRDQRGFKAVLGPATRDLANPAEKRALRRVGEGWSSLYGLAVGLRPVELVRIDLHGNLS